MNKSDLQLRPLSDAIASICGFLNFGRTEEMGSTRVTANAKGYTFIFNGKVVARGKTPQELHESWIKAVNYAAKKHEEHIQKGS